MVSRTMSHRLMAFIAIPLLAYPLGCWDLFGEVKTAPGEEGSPLAGAVVTWSCGAGETGADGAYRIANIGSGKACRLVGVEHDGVPLEVAGCEENGVALAACDVPLMDADTNRDIVLAGFVGCPVTGDIGSGQWTITLGPEGERNYVVFVPSGYDPATPTPVVLNLHGLKSYAEEQILLSGMNGTAEAEGFVVVYPNGEPLAGGAGNRWFSGGRHVCASTARVFSPRGCPTAPRWFTGSRAKPLISWPRRRPLRGTWRSREKTVSRRGRCRFWPSTGPRTGAFFMRTRPPARTRSPRSPTGSPFSTVRPTRPRRPSGRACWRRAASAR